MDQSGKKLPLKIQCYQFQLGFKCDIPNHPNLTSKLGHLIFEGWKQQVSYQVLTFGGCLCIFRWSDMFTPANPIRDSTRVKTQPPDIRLNATGKDLSAWHLHLCITLLNFANSLQEYVMMHFYHTLSMS